MKGARPRFTRAITQPLSTFDVSLAAELTSKFLVTENSSAKLVLLIAYICVSVSVRICVCII